MPDRTKDIIDGKGYWDIVDGRVVWVVLSK